MLKKVISKIIKKKEYPKLAYASIIKRALAFIIDNIFILSITTIITNIATDKYYLATGASLYVLFMSIYLIICSRFQGTIGKIVMHLKVTDLHGHKIKWWRSIIRFLIGLFYLGDLLILFTKKKQTLKDFIARTVVVDKKK